MLNHQINTYLKHPASVFSENFLKISYIALFSLQRTEILVEAAGIEPASNLGNDEVSTCLAAVFISASAPGSRILALCRI